MWTREQRLAAFKNPQVVREGDKLYLAVTADFGVRLNETLMDTLYQRIRQEGDVPRKWWHGTKLAADHRFEKREAQIAELRAFLAERDAR